MSQDKPVLDRAKELMTCFYLSQGFMEAPEWEQLGKDFQQGFLGLAALDRQGWTQKQAQQLAAFREAHCTGAHDEAWHQIYWLVADQAADQYNPWAEVDALAAPHASAQINEPPQAGQEPSPPPQGSAAGPASGSPDVVERLEAQFYAGNDQIVLRDDCIRALRALEADRSVLRQQLGDSEKSSARDRLRLGDIKKVCESLQSELDRVRKALEEFVRIDEEEGGLYAKDTATSDLVLALDAAKKALPTLGERG